MAAPKPQYQKASLQNSKHDKFEDKEQLSNFVESSKPSLHDKNLEKECQPPAKDVENEKGPRLPNYPKDVKKLDEGHRQRKFDENYGKASGVPYWVNTRCDYEVCIKESFEQPIESKG